MLLFILPILSAALCHSIQIHLMLLFIFSRIQQFLLHVHIQIHLMLLFIFTSCNTFTLSVYSNTSHVIVYPEQSRNGVGTQTFKYISCYCLSCKSILISLHCNPFKYISCYCLSHIFAAFLELLYYILPHYTAFLHFFTNRFPTIALLSPFPHIFFCFRCLLRLFSSFSLGKITRLDFPHFPHLHFQGLPPQIHYHSLI